MVKASMGLAVAFGVLAVLVAAAFPLLLHRAESAAGYAAGANRRALRAALATAVWMAATFAAAASGRLSFATVPPTMAVVIVLSLALALRIGVSGTGGRIAAGVPLALLVGVQGFRLPLELLMHRAYAEGLMPVQMSYSGRNFDIVTGTTAILLAAALWLAPQRVSPKLVLLWNVLGSLLLLNVLTIAILSAPTPLRVFTNEPANVWITQAPFVWLPAVFVAAALAGHIVIFRRLRLEMAASNLRRAGSEAQVRTPAAIG
ncbi:MAG TPA: hypothetical protein VGO40_19750 [Longimicrobium sp.]|nr:hypothetical protein [Longimicrobium sp.]